MLSPTTDAERVELFDQLWNDLRRRDDRSEFFECEHCGRPIRWIRNIGSSTSSSLQIVAHPITTGRWFEPEQHAGLVAVFVDRTGFTIGRSIERDEIEDAFLYPCHWDVCTDARRIRDRLHRERVAGASLRGEEDLVPDPEVMRRYVQWRRELT